MFLSWCVVYGRRRELEERIDTTCRGGYSKVHKSKYRGMTYVAIKELLMDIAELDERVLLEFAREIEIMTLHSHKNVARFFGAGKIAAKLLLSSAPLSMVRKLRFALDASRKMEFLHCQSPLRIHRDLKTANLLVDRSWVVS
ncbi:dual specificity protein kinase shkA-like [Oscarella lobularis]|uniref:dual specificity protein kinase shkA-like n=1 Tax=Oscarella lobularis TaxID=121494 RepID=UPI003313C78F